MKNTSQVDQATQKTCANKNTLCPTLEKWTLQYFLDIDIKHHQFSLGDVGFLYIFKSIL